MQDNPREAAARRAIDAGDWQMARAIYEELTRDTNTPEAWAGLAEVAWLQQDSRLMIDARLAEEARRLARGPDCADVEVLATAMSGLALVMNGQPAPECGSLRTSLRAALWTLP